jgi:hypothetical protein
LSCSYFVVNLHLSAIFSSGNDSLPAPTEPSSGFIGIPIASKVWGYKKWLDMFASSQPTLVQVTASYFPSFRMLFFVAVLRKTPSAIYAQFGSQFLKVKEGDFV